MLQDVHYQNSQICVELADLLKGEFLKRDNTFSVSQIDQGAVVEALEFKEDALQKVLSQLAISEKQKSLEAMGLSDQNPQTAQQYQQAIQDTIKTFNETEAKFKNFRTIGAKWAQKVLKIQEERYELQENLFSSRSFSFPHLPVHSKWNYWC